MNDTREEISKLIKELSERQKELGSLSSSQFESLIAELTAQHKQILEIKRSIAPHADLLLSIRNQENIISKYAFELKLAQKYIDRSSIEQFRKYINEIGAERGYFVTSGQFTENAKKLAEEFHSKLRLIDHEALHNWIRQYQEIQENFASSLIARVSHLPLNELCIIKEEEIEKENIIQPSSLILPQEYQEKIIRVENIPFRLLYAILHDPRHMRYLTPRQFEEFVAEIVEKLGFTNVILTPKSGDGGRDVIALMKLMVYL